MWKPRSLLRSLFLLHFLLLLLYSVLPLVSAQVSNATTWNTLSGNPPLVIARGGFSGIFPDSSESAYIFGVTASLKNVIVWCDVQLTKDSQGICVPNVKLENATDIAKKAKYKRILVPKDYIWLVDPTSHYLQPHTSLVSDAHKVGLEVFASTFQNDIPISYNYNYDHVSSTRVSLRMETFLLMVCCPTSPNVICSYSRFAHMGLNAPKKVNTLVISKYGASGDYPPCTDLAYKKAILDGVDILDCPVQMSKDGIPFCFNSIDLIKSTNVAKSSFEQPKQIYSGDPSSVMEYLHSTWHGMI
ncbi:hypothetical protein ACSQ67_011706 [Phaseolus vulgaris]